MEATLTMPAAAPVQKQQGLNQVVINKVRRMVEGRQPDVMAAITRLLEEGKIAQDYMAPIGVSRRNGEQRPVVSFKAADRVQLSMPEGDFSLHANAIGQVSEKMGIPAKYLRELSAGAAWQKQLCATILNEHSGWTERTRVLVRAVGTEVRGILSDSYRRLNSSSLPGHVSPRPITETVRWTCVPSCSTGHASTGWCVSPSCGRYIWERNCRTQWPFPKRLTNWTRRLPSLRFPT